MTCLGFCWTPESCVFPAQLYFQAKVDPPKMLLPYPISQGTHTPGPAPPHPPSVSAAPNTYSSTGIRSKDGTTREIPKILKEQQITKETSTASAQPVMHPLQVRGWETPVPLAHKPRGANNSRHNISFRFRRTKPQRERAI